jgi:manganese transport protein
MSRSLGPGLLVVAAVIGPGTVTTASAAGVNFGFALLWAVAFSTFATIVLQEMAARLGVVSRKGLGEALRTTFRNPVFNILAVFLVVAAIAFGNIAFETGNIAGAAIALTVLTGISPRVWALAVGAGAFLLLASGTYKVIEGALVVMVAGMSAVFLLTALIVRPNVGDILTGICIPSLPTGAPVTVMALIGTTVVPYSLFLHASSVQERWPQSIPSRQALAESRLDTFLSMTLGGLITLAIVATAAATLFGQITKLDSAATMAKQLEPLLGPAAKYFFATGLLAAGLTSAVTAPLAAAYAASGALGWEKNLKDWKFRALWAVTVVIGTALAFLGQNPVAAIIFAQAANGALLPVVAGFLLVVMNRSDLLQEYTNGLVANILGTVVVLIAAGLGVFQILKAF